MHPSSTAAVPASTGAPRRHVATRDQQLRRIAAEIQIHERTLTKMERGELTLASPSNVQARIASLRAEHDRLVADGHPGDVVCRNCAKPIREGEDRDDSWGAPMHRLCGLELTVRDLTEELAKLKRELRNLSGGTLE